MKKHSNLTESGILCISNDELRVPWRHLKEQGCRGRLTARAQIEWPFECQSLSDLHPMTFCFRPTPMRSIIFFNILGVLMVLTLLGKAQLFQLLPKITVPSERVDGRFSPATSRRKKQPVRTICGFSGGGKGISIGGIYAKNSLLTFSMP